MDSPFCTQARLTPAEKYNSGWYNPRQSRTRTFLSGKPADDDRANEIFTIGDHGGRNFAKYQATAGPVF